MHRLKIGIGLAVTGTRAQTQSSDRATGYIGQNIAMLVAEHHYIQGFWASHQTTCQIVDQKLNERVV